MGDAYAKASGELTLVSVHSGPGLTNALTGIGEAAKSRTPLVVLAGTCANGAVKNNSTSNRPNGPLGRGGIRALPYGGECADDALRAVTRAMRDRRQWS